MLVRISEGIERALIGTRVTVSVGVTGVPPTTFDGAEAFIKQADAMLYKAK